MKLAAANQKLESIIKNVEKLGSHISKYDEYYNKLGNTLATAVNHYNAGYKELAKVDKDVMKITGESTNIDPLALAKPEKDE